MLDIIIEALLEAYNEIIFEAIVDTIITIIAPYILLLRQYFRR